MIRRLAALVYDFLLLVALWFVATAVILPLNQGEAFQPRHWAYLAYLATLAFLFFGWCWTHGGQTLGMRAWSLRLLRTDGGPIDWSVAARRFGGAVVSLACGGLGYLWILIDRRDRAWHDRWSGTAVVIEVPSAR
ncbi:MAG: RDD family protein [Methylotetracoccus sp.]